MEELSDTMTKILITGGTSAQALKLIKAFPGDTVILADYGDMPSVQLPSYRLISLGVKNISATAHLLLAKCLDENIDLLIPLHEFELRAVAAAATLFNEYGIRTLVPDISQVDVYLSAVNASAGWRILENGHVTYPWSEAIYPGLTGVFYTDEAGAPVTLFTV